MREKSGNPEVPSLAGGEQVWQLVKTNVDNVKGIHYAFLMFKGTVRRKRGNSPGIQLDSGAIRFIWSTFISG